MQIEIVRGLQSTPVPRSTWSPWLDKMSHKKRLTDDFVLTVDGQIYTVPEGYIFDGASIPRWLWWMFPPGYSEAMQAACFHDYCYSHLYRQVTKQFADEAFKAIMLHDRASPFVAGIFYKAVCLFGKGGW